jgi:hypothetical protein
MKINTKLLAFASGVALTALLHVGGLWANNKRWESEMVNHGWGYTSMTKWTGMETSHWSSIGMTSPKPTTERIGSRFEF